MTTRTTRKTAEKRPTRVRVNAWDKLAVPPVFEEWCRDNKKNWRWKRIMTNGQQDASAINAALRQGWEFVQVGVNIKDEELVEALKDFYRIFQSVQGINGENSKNFICEKDVALAIIDSDIADELRQLPLEAARAAEEADRQRRLEATQALNRYTPVTDNSSLGDL